MNIKWISVVLLAGMMAFASRAEDAWQKTLSERLALYGHRNWIVIADSAYPAQTSAGIETIATNADQLELVKAVLAELAKHEHVSPNVFTDAEMPFVPENDAPGITKYREQLAQILGAKKATSLEHEQIIAKLDEAGKTFKVLILKTKLAIPYTSVFLQLDCKYWNAHAEKRLREAIAK